MTATVTGRRSEKDTHSPFDEEPQNSADLPLPLICRNVYVGSKRDRGVRTPGDHFAPRYTFRDEVFEYCPRATPQPSL